MPLQSQLSHEGSVADPLLEADYSPDQHCHHNSHRCMLVCSVAVLFDQASFNVLALNTYPALLCFLHFVLNPPVCFPVLLCSFCFIFKSFLSSQRSRTCLVIQGFFLRRFFPSISLAALVVDGNYGINAHVLISQILQILPPPSKKKMQQKTVMQMTFLEEEKAIPTAFSHFS